MPDRFRPIAYHLFIALILGGLWMYADMRRDIDLARREILGPVDPEILRQARSQYDESDVGAACPTTRPVARADTLTNAGGFDVIGE